MTITCPGCFACCETLYFALGGFPYLDWAPLVLHAARLGRHFHLAG